MCSENGKIWSDVQCAQRIVSDPLWFLKIDFLHRPASEAPAPRAHSSQVGNPLVLTPTPDLLQKLDVVSHA